VTVSVVSFSLPFALVDMPTNPWVVPLNGPWLVLNGSAVTRAIVPCAVSLLRVDHRNEEFLKRLPFQSQGDGEWTYAGDRHGIFATTDVEIRVNGHLVPDFRFTNDIAVRSVRVVNTLIRMHRAYSAKWWSPRVEPGDILGLSWALDRGDGPKSVSAMMGSAAYGILDRATAPIFRGDPPPYRVLQEYWDRQWAELILDGMAHLYALRAERACTMAVIGVELFMNEVMRPHLSDEQFSKAQLAHKGGKFYAAAFGRGLDNKGEFGEFACIWRMVVKARNELLHRLQTSVDYTTIDKKTQTLELRDETHAGLFLAEVCRLLAFLADRHLRDPNTAPGGPAHGT